MKFDLHGAMIEDMDTKLRQLIVDLTEILGWTDVDEQAAEAIQDALRKVGRPWYEDRCGRAKIKETLSSSDLELLRAVYDMQSLGGGYAGMFTGRIFRKRKAQKLEDKGYLVSSWMDVTDDDGRIRENCQQRIGYRLTQSGLDMIPEEYEDGVFE